jgi:hypothetical protein
VVHPITTRSTERAATLARQYGSVGNMLPVEATIPQRYVLIPDPLIVAYAHDPLAVGIYAAIARLAVATKGAVPLAARDLALWMGSRRDADRAAIMRRIVKLEEGGWVMIERSTATKHRLLPTWGRDQNHAIRPWRFDSSDSGRPSHLRGRRVPLALFDAYIGRLEPQSGLGRALISRYLTRPLLDLTDIGVYAIGLRAEIEPTPRLCHLGLHSAAGMLPPQDNRSLLQQAAAGALTTLVDDVMMPVLLSVQGQIRLGRETPAASPWDPQGSERLRGSTRRSPDGSRNVLSEQAVLPHQDGQKTTVSSTASLIAWDVGRLHESTNHDSTPDHGFVAGGSAATSVKDLETLSNQPVQIQTTINALPPRIAGNELAEGLPLLLASVAAGHRSLNPTRTIPSGEWHELLALQDTHRGEQLLIWQARAHRAMTARPYGITPAYYRACAAQAACDAYRPTATYPASALSDRERLSDTPPGPPIPDAACDALLKEMGVRERHRLGDVSYDLVAAWQMALTHPGMQARFTSPVGLAVAQMRRGNAPPPITELDRWVEHARRKDDRYEVWRYVEAPAMTEDVIAGEQQLEARVRAIAPPDADLTDLCELARCIEAGATDAEALASLHAMYTGG